MDKFNSERVETLKCQFYKLLGHLEMKQNFVVSDVQIRVFEKTLAECDSEDEAAAFVLGRIRRYKIMLGTGAT